MIGLAAGGAGRQLRRQAGGEQQLQAKGELVCVRGLRACRARPRVQQRELVAQQREHARMRVVGLEQP
jgi:hypothetical protein